MDGDVQESLDLDFTRIEGNVENGRELFHLKDSCSKCHGNKGSGVYNAPQLNNQDFLKIATDSYIEATVMSDRMKIPRMPSADELNDVIAYIRSWQK